MLPRQFGSSIRVRTFPKRHLQASAPGYTQPMLPHNTGVGISYLVVIGDLMPDVMKQFLDGGVMCERSFWVVMMTVFVLIPLASLRYVSLQRDIQFHTQPCSYYEVGHSRLIPDASFFPMGSELSRW